MKEKVQIVPKANMFQQMRTRRTTSQAVRLFSVTVALFFSTLMVRCSEIFTVPGMLPALPGATINSAHLISCAIACSQKECITVYYQDGNCTLGGTGMTQNISGPHILEKMPYTSPLSFRTLPDNLPTNGSSSVLPWWCSEITDANSWWKLDMLGSFWVHGIDLLPRAASDDYYLFHRVEVRVGSVDVLDGNFSAWTLFAFYPGPYQINSGYLKFVSAEGVFGKYIAVRKGPYPPMGGLKLMDVKVTVRA
ncbi:uncharacterized protein [Macrobrachium rosenbergii]|uniref:uncharacterized protein n=1 Tax=Macrobrachium rosenbergii TaxID=79674 RepID=UPI0034D6B390